MKRILTLLIFLSFFNTGFSQINEIDSPKENFEKLWKTFNNRYANFDLKEVNWNEIYKKYNILINENTTNKELFEICCAMLQELNDGHVTIEPNFVERNIECGPPYEFSLDIEFGSDSELQKFNGVISQELEKNGFLTAIRTELTEGTNFQYRLSESYGYLRLDEMTEKITYGKFQKTIDKAIEAFKNKKGLIIDLRFNGGGWDHHSYKLASRFISEGTISHFERKRIKGTNEYSKLKEKKVKPGGKIQFTKPIVILTSDFTASAAEVFVLLMKELPNVILIGDNTEGIFSDMYFFKLPNKWSVSLSYQQYFSNDKENYEGKGIPPNIKIVNSKLDIENNYDPVIKVAINHLDKQNNR